MGPGEAAGHLRIAVKHIPGGTFSTYAMTRLTSLTFSAADGGWTLQGVLTDVPDCEQLTWMCL